MGHAIPMPLTHSRCQPRTSLARLPSPSRLSSLWRRTNNRPMAALDETSSMLVKQVLVLGKAVAVVRLSDRRTQSAEPLKWAFQSQLEAVLYGGGYGQSTGAMYSLLKRTHAAAQTLPLKKASVAAGIVTEGEFRWLATQLHDSVRSFTLVPLPLVEAAMATYGRCDKSEALLAALELHRPDQWESEEGEDDNDQPDSDTVSVAKTEVADEDADNSSVEGESGEEPIEPSH